MIEDLDSLSKKVFISLLEKRRQCNDDNEFYNSYPKLYNNAKKTRQQKYKRKAIILFVENSNTELQKNIDQAIKDIKERNKNKHIEINKESIKIITSKSTKDLKKLNIKCSPYYSDIIAFIPKSEKDQPILSELLQTIKEENTELNLYPNLVLRYDKKPNLTNLINAFENSLYFSKQTNNDKKSSLWNSYAFNDELFHLLKSQLDCAKRNNNLNEVLKDYDFSIYEDNEIISSSKPRVLIFGKSLLKDEEMKEVIKDLGLNAELFDLKTEYNNNDINFEKFRYSTKYSEIMVGPNPHKVKGTRGYSSCIALLEDNKEIYPKCIQIRNKNGELKITRESFKEALKKTYMYKMKEGNK